MLSFLNLYDIVGYFCVIFLTISTCTVNLFNIADSSEDLKSDHKKNSTDIVKVEFVPVLWGDPIGRYKPDSIIPTAMLVWIERHTFIDVLLKHQPLKCSPVELLTESSFRVFVLDPSGFFDTPENTVWWFSTMREKLNNGQHEDFYSFFRVDTSSKTIYLATSRVKR